MDIVKAKEVKDLVDEINKIEVKLSFITQCKELEFRLSLGIFDKDGSNIPIKVDEDVFGGIEIENNELCNKLFKDLEDFYGKRFNQLIKDLNKLL